MLNFYIGWDSREADAYNVCLHTLKKHTTINCTVLPLKTQELAELNFYNKRQEQDASTEFTYTRFLVPFLNNYKGWALFCDCDFLFLRDIKELLHDIFIANKGDMTKAVYVAQHDYEPKKI